jgi:hypothetical protein
MPQLNDEVLYDVRLIERHVRQGLLTRAEADKRLKEIKDQGDNADVIDLESFQNEISRRRR